MDKDFGGQTEQWGNRAERRRLAHKPHLNKFHKARPHILSKREQKRRKAQCRANRK